MRTLILSTAAVWLAAMPTAGAQEKAATALGLAVLGMASMATSDVRYSYDSAGRLIRVEYANGVTTDYSYDEAGNRTTVATAAGPNRQPVAANDTANVVTSGSVDILVRANDSDPDGDSLTIIAVSAVSGGGTATIMGGGTHIRYAAPATAGAKSFTYTVSDGRGGAATATVTVTVSPPPNRPPVAVNDSATVVTSRDVSIWVRANDSDPDGDPLTVTAVSAVSGGGTATIASGGTHVIYTSPATAGAKSFIYTISDGRGGTASATVNVTVNVAPPNQPPVVVDDRAALEYGDTWDIMVLSNDHDPDGDDLTVASITAPTCGTAQISPHSKYVTFTAPNFKRTCAFNYTASDGRGGTASTFVSVNVRAPGTPPPNDWLASDTDDEAPEPLS